MKRARSFSINKEEEKPKEEKLYKTKTCPCFRCIAITSLIAFTLLLILANVDFDGTAYTTTRAPVITRTTTTATTMLTTVIPTETTTVIGQPEGEDDESFEVYSNDPNAPFMCYIENACSVSCSGYVGNLTNILVAQQRRCATQLQICLKRCSFPGDRLGPNFFDGGFRVQKLVIENCNLLDITDGTFTSHATCNLTHLIIANSRLSSVSATTFAGLRAIKEFQLLNKQHLLTFEAHEFLMPIGATLKRTIVQHKSPTVVNDPTDWLGGKTQFTQLTTLNLNDNNFGDTLTERTFANFVQLQWLHLRNCSINAIGAKTFDGIAATLCLLDLSFNQLFVVNWNFLTSTGIAGSPMTLQLAENPWLCTCDNDKLIRAVQAGDVIIDQEAKCAAPMELQGVPLQKVHLKCTLEYRNERSVRATETGALIEIHSYVSGEWSAYDSTPSTSPYFNETTTEKAPTNETTTNEINYNSTWVSLPCIGSTTWVPWATTPCSTATTTTEVIPTNSTWLTTPYTTTEVMPTTDLTTEDIPTETTPRTSELTSTTTSTTQKYDNMIFITCTRQLQNANQTFIRTLRNYDVLFSIYSASSTSVQLHLYMGNVRDYTLLYFSPNDYTGCADGIYNEDICAHRWSVSMFATTTYIEELKNSISYVYCILWQQTNTMSPFNCRSHYTRSMPWLKISDLVALISISIIGVFVSLLVGIAIVFFVLRCRPTWVKGCERLRKASNASNLVYLLPKSSIYMDLFGKSEYISTNPSGEVQLNIKNFNSRIKFQECANPYHNKPPREYAPCTPAKPRKYIRKCQPPVFEAQNCVYRYNEYDSVEYYEEVL